MINKFLKYVEIMTKITSFYAFLLSAAYLFYVKAPIKIKESLIFFAAMFIFDLATTAINNYIDTKINGQPLQFSKKTALLIIVSLLFISTALGLYLAFLTDAVVLLAGAACFACGVFYTFGPVAVSRQPLGEVLSGFFYGAMIPFLMLYINMPQGTFLSYSFNLEQLNLALSINLAAFIALAFISAAPFFATANIMLANNICDLEKDISVKRHTLPYYLGKTKALKIFAFFYYIIYIVIIIGAMFKILPLLCLLILPTFLVVMKNINAFFAKQEKDSTFLLSVKNYVLIMSLLSLLIFVAGVIKPN